jgi:hypothetical protein
VLDATAGRSCASAPGRVDANLAAPSWYTTYSPGAIVPAAAGVDVPPRWTHAAAAPAFGWFDPRPDTAHVRCRPSYSPKGRAADLGEWIVPLRVDGTPVSLTGRFRYEPPSGAAVARLTSSSAPAPGVRVTLLRRRARTARRQRRPRGLSPCSASTANPSCASDPTASPPTFAVARGAKRARRRRRWSMTSPMDRAGRRCVGAALQLDRSAHPRRHRSLDGSSRGWTVPMRLGETPRR